MYDTSPLSPLKGEVHQLWPDDIGAKELESLLDPALEECLDFSELHVNTNLAGAPPVVPDSTGVVASTVAPGNVSDLLTLTVAATTEHLAKLEGQAAIFTAHNGVAIATPSPASLPLHTSASSPVVDLLPASLAADDLGQDLLMPEFTTHGAMTTPTTSATAHDCGGEWAQTPFYTTVKTEDLSLSSIPACSLEASLPGFTPTSTVLCKSEPAGQDDSCSDYASLSPRSTRSLSESSTATTMPDSPRRSSKGGSKRRQVPKGSEEYKEKRARNNIAVRKSRAKAKEKQRMTEERVKELMDMNENLQKRLEMLTKEVTVLKGLFINVGANLPDDYSKLMETS